MTSTTKQFSMRFADSDEPIGSDLMLGFATDHSRFFTALEDGWMRPLPSRRGVLIGIGVYANEISEHSSRHPILIRARVRSHKLPDMPIHVLRDGRWVESRMGGIRTQDTAIYWPGTMPVFTISELHVQTDEQRARLGGLAMSVSNLDLSPFQLNVVPHTEPWLELGAEPPASPPGVVIRHDVDSFQGALSMAIWGIPRTPPWMDVLVSSLSGDSERLERSTATVQAHWLQQPAWAEVADDGRSDTQSCLWRAAITVLRNQSSRVSLTPDQLVDEVAKRALRVTAKESSTAVAKWKESTISILRGDSTISRDHWGSEPVGVAIQLVLTRPDPVAFREWFRDVPNLPPAIAWTATVLCGLFHGYRRLDIQFRGDSVQREVVALHALHRPDQASLEHQWTPLQNTSVTWRNEANQFVLAQGAKEFARKSENSRSKWYTADFEDPNVRDEAIRFSRERKWPCIRRELRLSSGVVGLHGPGHISLIESPTKLQIDGTVHMQIPSNTDFDEALDVSQFLRLVSIESGPIPEPPTSKIRRFHVRSSPVPGLTYVRDFITLDEERRLIQTIDQNPWDNVSLQRSVQQYGWRYDYWDRKVDTRNQLGPLPDWIEPIALRLVSAMLIDQVPNQVIVNDYRRNQGITGHIDKPNMFADGIAMVSLNESWEMIFRPPSGHNKVVQLLDRRSVAVMKGDARYRWKHEIPRRKNEPGGIKRGRRISLTFRTVVPA